jgi:hypothetical protein
MMELMCEPLLSLPLPLAFEHNSPFAIIIYSFVSCHIQPIRSLLCALSLICVLHLSLHGIFCPACLAGTLLQLNVDLNIETFPVESYFFPFT